MNRKTIFIVVCCAVIAGMGTVGGVVVAYRMKSGHIAPDKRVEWVQPPGEFKAAGGRVEFDDITRNPGGFKDFGGRQLHFAGAVLNIDVNWTKAGADLPFAEFRNHGYSVIRVPVRWQDLEPLPMELSVDNILAIRSFLDRAAAAGVMVILQNTTPFPDFQTCGFTAAAPDWAFRSAVERDLANGAGDCDSDRAATSRTARDTYPRFHRDFVDATWTPDNIALQDHLIRSWVKLAEVVNRSAGLLGYGIAASMDCPGTTGGPLCQKAWHDFTYRFANGLRAVDASAIIFVGAGTTGGSTSPIAIITELAPIGADDFPARYLPETNAIFGYRHIRIGNGDEFIKTLRDIEERGRSFLVTISDPAAAAKFARDGVDPFARFMARPRPDAIAGTSARWSFDRLTLPAGPEELAVGAGRTDVFHLEFDNLATGGNRNQETTVRVPVDLLYAESADDGSPAFTVDVSDGTVEWLPGRSDTLIWRTVDTAARHEMKIVPWGGRRLDFITDLTDISAR